MTLLATVCTAALLASVPDGELSEAIVLTKAAEYQRSASITNRTSNLDNIQDGAFSFCHIVKRIDGDDAGLFGFVNSGSWSSFWSLVERIDSDRLGINGHPNYYHGSTDSTYDDEFVAVYGSVRDNGTGTFYINDTSISVPPQAASVILSTFNRVAVGAMHGGSLSGLHNLVVSSWAADGYVDWSVQSYRRIFRTNEGQFIKHTGDYAVAGVLPCWYMTADELATGTNLAGRGDFDDVVNVSVVDLRGVDTRFADSSNEVSLTNNTRTVTTATSPNTARTMTVSQSMHSTGKYYMEYEIVDLANTSDYIINILAASASEAGTTGTICNRYTNNYSVTGVSRNLRRGNGSGTDLVTSGYAPAILAEGDTLRILVNLDDNTLGLAHNDGTIVTSAINADTYRASVGYGVNSSTYDGGTITMKLSTSDGFKYAIPDGYSAWSEDTEWTAATTGFDKAVADDIGNYSFTANHRTVIKTTASNKGVPSAIAHSTGKHYFEYIPLTWATGASGITFMAQVGTNWSTLCYNQLQNLYLGNAGDGNGPRKAGSLVGLDNSQNSDFGDVIRVKYDADLGTVELAKGAGAFRTVFTGLTGAYVVCSEMTGDQAYSIRYRLSESDGFDYAIPAGYSAWSPDYEPSIMDKGISGTLVSGLTYANHTNATSTTHLDRFIDFDNGTKKLWWEFTLNGVEANMDVGILLDTTEADDAATNDWFSNARSYFTYFGNAGLPTTLRARLCDHGSLTQETDLTKTTGDVTPVRFGVAVDEASGLMWLFYSESNDGTYAGWKGATIADVEAGNSSTAVFTGITGSYHPFPGMRNPGGTMQYHLKESDMLIGMPTGYATLATALTDDPYIHIPTTYNTAYFDGSHDYLMHSGSFGVSNLDNNWMSVAITLVRETGAYGKFFQIWGESIDAGIRSDGTVYFNNMGNYVNTTVPVPENEVVTIFCRLHSTDSSKFGIWYNDTSVGYVDSTDNSRHMNWNASGPSSIGNRAGDTGNTIHHLKAHVIEFYAIDYDAQWELQSQRDKLTSLNMISGTGTSVAGNKQPIVLMDYNDIMTGNNRGRAANFGRTGITASTVTV